MDTSNRNKLKLEQMVGLHKWGYKGWRSNNKWWDYKAPSIMIMYVVSFDPTNEENGFLLSNL